MASYLTILWLATPPFTLVTVSRIWSKTKRRVPGRWWRSRKVSVDVNATSTSARDVSPKHTLMYTRDGRRVRSAVKPSTAVNRSGTRSCRNGIPTQRRNKDSSLHKNMSKKRTDLPAVLTSFVSRIPVLPETIVLFSVQFLPIPFIAEEDRLVIRPIDESMGVFRVVLNHGYQELEVDIIGILERARGMGITRLDTSDCIFFVGKISVESKAQLETDDSESQSTLKVTGLDPPISNPLVRDAE